MVALPAGLLASGFSEQLHQRRRKFEGEVDRIPRRGVISAEEGDRPKEIRDPARADRIRRVISATRWLIHRHGALQCPHRGRSPRPIMREAIG